jgi:flagellar motor switch protein FliM
MSGALTVEEINQLLTGTDAGDSKGLKHTAPLTQGGILMQDEIDQLLTAIDPSFGKRLNRTAPLTQDEIDRLLAAIEADNHTQI